MNRIRNQKDLEQYFQNAHHTDIKTIEGGVSLREFISGMLSCQPKWVLLLFRLRPLLVKMLGLKKNDKPEVLKCITPEELSFTPGKKASFFTVRGAKENLYWVAETPVDRHLKAYFGVLADPVFDRKTRFHVFTIVKYLHWTGPVYFNVIRPFHHLVVYSLMRYGIRNRDTREERKPSTP